MRWQVGGTQAHTGKTQLPIPEQRAAGSRLPALLHGGGADPMQADQQNDLPLRASQAASSPRSHLAPWGLLSTCCGTWPTAGTQV